jgi:hypothetical protein
MNGAQVVRNTMHTAHFHNKSNGMITTKGIDYIGLLQTSISPVDEMAFSVASLESSASSRSQLSTSEELVSVDSFDWTPVKLIPIRNTQWIDFEASSTIPQIVTVTKLKDLDDVSDATDDDDMDTTDDLIEILNVAAISYPNTNIFTTDDVWRFDIDQCDIDTNSSCTIKEFDRLDDLTLASTASL